jgi:hypothetical protein
VFGSSADLSVPSGTGRGGRISPEQMYDVLADFIGLEITTGPLSRSELASLSPDERQALADDLAEVRA